MAPLILLRETKYFQTLTKRQGNVLTIDGRDAMIVGSGHATIVLPMGTQITIEDALLYPDSKHTLLSYRDIRQNGFHIETRDDNNEEILLVTKDDLAKKMLRKLPLFLLDCTTHTSNPYHMLRTR